MILAFGPMAGVVSAVFPPPDVSPSSEIYFWDDVEGGSHAKWFMSSSPGNLFETACSTMWQLSEHQTWFLRDFCMFSMISLVPGWAGAQSTQFSVPGNYITTFYFGIQETHGTFKVIDDGFVHLRMNGNMLESYDGADYTPIIALTHGTNYLFEVRAFLDSETYDLYIEKDFLGTFDSASPVHGGALIIGDDSSDPGTTGHAWWNMFIVSVLNTADLSIDFESGTITDFTTVTWPGSYFDVEPSAHSPYVLHMANIVANTSYPYPVIAYGFSPYFDVQPASEYVLHLDFMIPDSYNKNVTVISDGSAVLYVDGADLYALTGHSTNYVTTLIPGVWYDGIEVRVHTASETFEVKIGGNIYGPYDFVPYGYYQRPPSQFFLGSMYDWNTLGVSWGEAYWDNIRINVPPELEPCGPHWPGYCGDIGVTPGKGDESTEFTYCVVYRDANGDAPNRPDDPRVHILDFDFEIYNEAMNEGNWLSPAQNYKDGRTYLYTTTLSMGVDYSYFFTAADVHGLQAYPTDILEGPDVVLNQWNEVQIDSGAIPSARDSHSMAYDVSGKIIMFGGYDGPTTYSDTWEFELPQAEWTKIAAANPPQARHSHSMVGLGNGWILLFGGMESSTYYPETWVYVVSSEMWYASIPNPSPQGRMDSYMAYDPDSNEVLLFGGLGENGQFDDTWIYNPGDTPSTGSWELVDPPGDNPEPRSRHGLVFDTERGKFILYGGAGEGSVEFQDTWTFDRTNGWEEMCVDPDCIPAQSYGFGIAYDSSSQVTVVYGGYSGLPNHWETFVYDSDLDYWTDMSTLFPGSHPGVRYNFPMVYSIQDEVIVLFGGLIGTNGAYRTDDTWTYDYF